MEFLDLVKNRYSCRKFCDKNVEEEKLLQILEAGRLAPTAMNHQPLKIFVVKSAQSLEKLRGITRMAYNAPVVLMVCYDKDLCYRALLQRRTRMRRYGCQHCNHDNDDAGHGTGSEYFVGTRIQCRGNCTGF